MNILIITLLSVLLSNCSFLYVAKQGIYQVKLVSQAESIEKVLRRTDLDATTRKKLELIIDVRNFAQEELHLQSDCNYKNVNLAWRHSIHTLSASQPLEFKPFLWWFPIIGSVPYKGYFDAHDAQLEETRLKALGLETQNYEVDGYSTLGYFSDPVWPSMLALSDEALIELVIHELTHATVYINNQTSFNETLANFVGKIGAQRYIHRRHGENSSRLKALHQHHINFEKYHRFFFNLYAKLDEIYQTNLPSNEKQKRKSAIMREAKSQYFSGGHERFNLDWNNVNNAYLLSFKRYNHDDTIFEKMLSAVNNDLRTFFAEVKYYGSQKDPFTSLWQRLDVLSKKL